MTDTIFIPESVRCYLNMSTVHDAVLKLLDKPDSIDSSFDWEELRQYHEALFSAYRVHHDYTMLLFNLMEEVCLKPAREKKLTKFFPLSKGEHYEKDMLPSPQNIWTDGLYCFLKGPGGKGYISFYITVEDGEESEGDVGNIVLFLDTDLIDEVEDLTPEKKWDWDDEQGWSLVDSGSLRGESLDLKRMRDAVSQALDAILK